jgi:hypothetical protein
VSAKSPFRRLYPPSNTGVSTTRTSTEMCPMRRPRCVPIIGSRRSRRRRSMTSRNELKARKRSRRPAAHQVSRHVHTPSACTDIITPRHIHRERTHAVLAVVPAEILGDTICLCGSSRCCHAAVLHNNSCTWRQFSHPPLVGSLCVANSHG